MEDIFVKYADIINVYYENKAQKLHSVVNNVLKKLRFTEVDKEEYYSLATEIFVKEVLPNYDPQKPFEKFLYSVLYKKFCTNMTKLNRDKRSNNIKVEKKDENGNLVTDEEGNAIFEKIKISDKSIDAPADSEGGTELKELLSSDYNMESFILENFYSEKVEKFLNNLNKTTRQIAEMLLKGFSASEIKQQLGITGAQYHQCYKTLTNFKNVQILKGKEYWEDETNMNTNNTTTQTMENCKTDKISIASIIKKIDKRTIRFDHPLQRESDQWTPSMKGNLVSDILQGNRLHPLIFAEQIINGVPIIWDLDGKQRCTNAYSYVNNGYKVSKNIRRWLIKYQTTEKDEKGNDILDENGFQIAKNEEFDIRGKRFSELPEELQEKFLDYTFNYDQYLNCSEDDIGYHIERYNDGKPMTKPQKGITKIGTEFAEMVKSIANMPFFKNIGGYKASEFNNGTIERVVIESVMSANYFDDWNKEVEKQCKYIKENSTIEIFENFEDIVERLEKVVTDDVADMFDSKDSFLYFGLFARFIETGLDDKKFIEFMAEFSLSLHNKNIDGVTYDELCINEKTGKTYGTKDKYVVTPKMKMLEKLMKEYLHISGNERTESISKEEFISMNVNLPIEKVEQDMRTIQSVMAQNC